jgi:hypothetical protein
VYCRRTLWRHTRRHSRFHPRMALCVGPRLMRDRRRSPGAGVASSSSRPSTTVPLQWTAKSSRKTSESGSLERSKYYPYQRFTEPLPRLRKVESSAVRFLAAPPSSLASFAPCSPFLSGPENPRQFRRFAPRPAPVSSTETPNGRMSRLGWCRFSGGHFGGRRRGSLSGVEQAWSVHEPKMPLLLRPVVRQIPRPAE